MLARQAESVARVYGGLLREETRDGVDDVVPGASSSATWPLSSRSRSRRPGEDLQRDGSPRRDVTSAVRGDQRWM